MNVNLNPNIYILQRNNKKQPPRDSSKNKGKLPVSDAAKDLMKKMLCKSPKERLGMDDILKHKWMSATSDITRQDEVSNRMKQSQLRIKKYTRSELVFFEKTINELLHPHL